MKDISLIFVFFIIQYSLSANVITMDVKGGIDRSSISCQEGYYRFIIPVENIQNLHEEKQLEFGIPLLSPPGTSVSCFLASTFQNEDYNDYLFCTYWYDLYYTKIEFAST